MDNFEWITTLFAVISMTATTIIYHERRYAKLELKLTQMVSQEYCQIKRLQLRNQLRLRKAPVPQKTKNIMP